MSDPVENPAHSPTIVLLYNSWDETLRLIKTYYDYVENIWLVDNNSLENRTEEALSKFPNIRVIRLSYNGGWAYGYNRALELAVQEGYDSAYLLNSDAVPEEGAVEAALAALKSAPRIAAVGSVILSPDGEDVEYDGEHYRQGSRPRSSKLTQDIKSTNRVHGAGMAINTRAFEDVGPFAEEYFLYHEETDWLVRAMGKGWTLLVNRKSVVRHMDGGSDINQNSMYYRVRNRFIAYRRGVSLSDKEESLLLLIKDQFGHTYQRDRSLAFAAKEGLVHGILGKVGPRPKKSSSALVDTIMLAVRFINKFQSIIVGRQRS